MKNNLLKPLARRRAQVAAWSYAGGKFAASNRHGEFFPIDERRFAFET
jgi:hypothetical protein